MYSRVVWGKLFRIDILKERHFQNLKISEDTCFMMDIIKDNFKVCLITNYLYNYLRRDSSVTSNKRFRIEDFDWLKGMDYIKQQVKEICPNYIKDIEYRKAEILVNMYYLLIKKGTREEKLNYKRKIRT